MIIATIVGVLLSSNAVFADETPNKAKAINVSQEEMYILGKYPIIEEQMNDLKTAAENALYTQLGVTVPKDLTFDYSTEYIYMLDHEIKQQLAIYLEWHEAEVKKSVYYTPIVNYQAAFISANGDLAHEPIELQWVQAINGFDDSLVGIVLKRRHIMS